MVSYVQLKKVRELSAQGYYGDDETQAVTIKETKGAIGGATFMKTPEGSKIVEIDAAGSIKPYKPAPAPAARKIARPSFGSI